MSSKTQFKEALKGDKKIIADLRKQIEEFKEKVILREDIIDRQRELIDTLRNELNKKRKWYQFWK